MLRFRITPIRLTGRTSLAPTVRGMPGEPMAASSCQTSSFSSVNGLPKGFARCFIRHGRYPGQLRQNHPFGLCRAHFAEVSPLYTATSLRSYTYKDLAQMAKQRGVARWHSMRKDQLVRALVKSAKDEAAKSKPTKTKKSASSSKTKTTKATAARRTPKSKSTSNGSTKAAKPNRRIVADHKLREARMDLATPEKKAPQPAKSSAANGRTGPGSSAQQRDRIVLMVRDPYWLHAHWELTRGCVDRARAALAEMWHTAKPILRLYDVDAGTTTNTSERIAQDIEIHGGVQNWYISVAEPPKSYVLEIGYLASDNRFHRVARSNVVTTPRPGTNAGADQNWDDVAANCQRIYALSGGYTSQSDGGELQELFEERLKRPMGTPMTTAYGAGAAQFLGRENDFDLQVDAEMILHGVTKPNAHLMLGGEPIQVNPDGTFSVRLELGNQRQVIPVVAESLDGVQQRTIVVAVERNTKVMEPVTRDPNEV